MLVMAGLIRLDLNTSEKDVDAGDKTGHDD
jgi:hypothetical protein